MNDLTDVLHVASPRACNVQQVLCEHATTGATPRATTALKAASLRVLARNRACNNYATRCDIGVQQTLQSTDAVVASSQSLTAAVAELSGLIARLANRAGRPDPASIVTIDTCAGYAREALRCLQTLAADRRPDEAH
jgi:hypothetical protein